MQLKQTRTHETHHDKIYKINRKPLELIFFVLYTAVERNVGAKRIAARKARAEAAAQ